MELDSSQRVLSPDVHVELDSSQRVLSPDVHIQLDSSQRVLSPDVHVELDSSQRVISPGDHGMGTCGQYFVNHLDLLVGATYCPLFNSFYLFPSIHPFI